MFFHRIFVFFGVHTGTANCESCVLWFGDFGTERKVCLVYGVYHPPDVNCSSIISCTTAGQICRFRRSSYRCPLSVSSKCPFILIASLFLVISWDTSRSVWLHLLSDSLICSVINQISCVCVCFKRCLARNASLEEARRREEEEEEQRRKAALEDRGRGSAMEMIAGVVTPTLEGIGLNKVGMRW